MFCPVSTNLAGAPRTIGPHASGSQPDGPGGCVQTKAADGIYRGRRRVPKFVRSRYAAVVSTAVLGAALMVLIAGATLPDTKRTGPTYAQDAAALSVISADDQQAAADRASRTKNGVGPALSVDQGAPDVWLLPLHGQYVLTTLFEFRWGAMHEGVDLAIGWGTPFYAAHAGTVILCRWNGGFGYNVQIDHGQGIVTIYGHASRLACHEGEHVDAGELIGFVGDTGDSFGDHLHFQVDLNNTPTDPIPFMLNRGVDIPRHLEAATGGAVVS
jgi:murein DD-endopeptidase MepM/ murein hydrolase activator NlpD